MVVKPVIQSIGTVLRRWINVHPCGTHNSLHAFRNHMMLRLSSEMASYCASVLLNDTDLCKSLVINIGPSK